MPKNAQQIIDDFQSLERKERQEKVDHLYDVSHGLDTFAKEFADHDDELDVEQKQDLFHMFQGMKALNTIAHMASGEKNLNEKQLNSNVKKLADLKLDTLFAKTIDEKTAKTIGRPEWAGKTYHEALADHLEDDEYIDIKDFDESLAFVNNELELGMNLKPLGISAPEQSAPQSQRVNQNTAGMQQNAPQYNNTNTAPSQNNPQYNNTNNRPRQNAPQYNNSTAPRQTNPQYNNTAPNRNAQPNPFEGGYANYQNNFPNGSVSPGQPQNPFAGGYADYQNNFPEPEGQQGPQQGGGQPAQQPKKESSVLEQLIQAIIEAITGVSKKTGMQGPANEMNRQPPNGNGSMENAQQLVQNVQRQMVNAPLTQDQAQNIRPELESLQRSNFALNEAKAFEASGLSEGKKELSDLQTMFSTRTARLYGNSSEYKNAKTALDNYIEARNNLVKNYEDTVEEAFKSGNISKVNDIKSKRGDLEKKYKEAESTLRSQMTTYVNKVSKNGTKSIDEMSHGYGAARLAGGNGVLGFLDKHGSAANTRDSRFLKDGTEATKEDNYRKKFTSERVKNESGKDRRRRAADAALEDARRAKNKGGMSM